MIGTRLKQVSRLGKGIHNMARQSIDLITICIAFTTLSHHTYIEEQQNAIGEVARNHMDTPRRRTAGLIHPYKVRTGAGLDRAGQGWTCRASSERGSFLLPKDGQDLYIDKLGLGYEPHVRNVDDHLNAVVMVNRRYVPLLGLGVLTRRIVKCSLVMSARFFGL